MFFYASKILWWFAAPSNVLIGLVTLGSLASFTRFFRWGRCILALGVLGFLVAGFSPLGFWLARPLEDRFPSLSLGMAEPTGFIVLGGSIDENLTAARDQVAISAAAGRITEAAVLAHRFPNARLVFTGGSNAVMSSNALHEAEAAKRLFIELGIAPERITIEQESRNTWENAVLTKKLLQPKAGERWLLVTSAWHMPRAIGIFRVVGFEVTPFPVDYLSRGDERELWRPIGRAAQGLDLVDTMVREWIGLVAYRLAGRTDALFPAP